jgi:hypothetical protein
MNVREGVMGLLTCSPDSGKTRRNSCFAALFVVLAALPMANVKAEAFRIAPDSRIALEVGGSFMASRSFSGFLDENSGVSFVTSEMPGSAYDDVKVIGDDPTALAQHGITITQKSVLPEREGEYVYITGQQRNGNATILKFLLIMRQNDITGMITVNVPQTALTTGQITKKQIEHILTTAKVVPTSLSKEEKFWLEYQGPFKEALRGPSKVYNLTGASPEQFGSEPLFVVSIDQSESPTPELATQQAFKLIGGFRDHTIKTENSININGLQGYSIIGTANEVKKGKPVGVYFVMLARKTGNYYVMIGIAPAQEMPDYINEFIKMANSFKTRE